MYFPSSNDVKNDRIEKLRKEIKSAESTTAKNVANMESQIKSIENTLNPTKPCPQCNNIAERTTFYVSLGNCCYKPEYLYVCELCKVRFE